MTDLTPKLRAELRETMREADKTWKHESENRGSEASDRAIRGVHGGRTARRRGLREHLLEYLKVDTITTIDESTGEFIKTLAFVDGKALCCRRQPREL